MAMTAGPTKGSFLFFVLGRVLCETVKDFVSKVGTASANSEPWQAEEPDSLTQKVEKAHIPKIKPWNVLLTY